MKRTYQIFIYLAIALITGVAAYYITTRYLPNFIFNKLHNRSISRGYADNELAYHPLLTDTARSVVMPNPDFLYVSCFYNIKDAPLRMMGTLPDSTYWSVAFYEPNTVNWYIKNDMEYSSNELDLIITQEGKEYQQNFGKTEIAQSPTSTGFMLIRILITDTSEKSVAKYRAWQKSVQLTVLD